MRSSTIGCLLAIVGVRRATVLAIAFAIFLGGFIAARSEDTKPKSPIYDTTVFWRPLYPFDVKVKADVPFYVGGWFVGFGEDGFKAVIEKIRHLPAGASVVWGPDCGKMPNGPGNEVVARDLFPKLWKHFFQVAKEKNVILSSAVWPGAAPDDEPPGLPQPHYLKPGDPKEKGDVILEWKPPRGKNPPIYEYWETKEWPVYSLDGTESGRGPGGFLDTLKALRKYPIGSRLRIVWHKSDEPSGITMFSLEFRKLVADKQFQLAVECNKTTWPKIAQCPAFCRFEWRNFRSAATPHEEVVYLVDGKLAGRGHEGFDAVLKRLQQLPPGANVKYPKYRLHGQVSDYKELEWFKSKDIVPFVQQKKDLDRLIEQRHLVVERDYVLYWPKPVYSGHVDEEYESHCFLHSLLGFASIIRDGAKPHPAEATISWKQDRDEQGTPASEATYFYDGKKAGIGAKGFLIILDRLGSLHDGSTIQINPICIRTQGPFADPIVVKGQHHFETTGQEPFRGMVDLLAEIVRRKHLHVEAIPDEGRPNHCPGGK